MKLVEKFDDVDDLCNNKIKTNFGNSLASQVAGMFGFGSVANATGINAESKLLEKIQQVQSRLQTVKWQCSQKIFLTQDANNEKRYVVLTNLQNFLDENSEYLQTKYMFEEERLGLLEGAISVMTVIVVFVILYFLKFK
jgi:hypothetical protein